jgi:hypothetical protein
LISFTGIEMALIQRIGLVLLSATFLLVLVSSLGLCRLLARPPLPLQRLEEGGRHDSNVLPPTLPRTVGDERPPGGLQGDDEGRLQPVDEAEGVDQVQAAEAVGALGGLADPPAAGAAAAAAASQQLAMKVLTTTTDEKTKKNRVSRLMAKYEKK